MPLNSWVGEASKGTGRRGFRRGLGGVTPTGRRTTGLATRRSRWLNLILAALLIATVAACGEYGQDTQSEALIPELQARVAELESELFVATSTTTPTSTTAPPATPVADPLAEYLASAAQPWLDLNAELAAELKKHGKLYYR